MKKFSIITPVYGDAYKTLGACYDALKEQNYVDWEMIIVFDGPNKEGIKNLKKGFKLERAGKKILLEPLKDKRVSWTVIEHGGAPKARNKGVELSIGDYITLIDPDVYLFPGTLKDWADKLEENKDCDFVYGDYEIVGGFKIPSMDFSRKVMESNNYISGAFPIKRSAWINQDESLPSLQDWDMWLSITKNSKGKYYPKSYFITEQSKKGSISDYSATHWIELTNKIRNKHGIPKSDLSVLSLGAEHHAINAATILDADVPIRTIHKPHKYKAVYVLGFYPTAFKEHLALFATPAYFETGEFTPNKAKKIIHWIGTDVLQMHKSISYDAIQSMKKMFKDMKVINLTECKQTHDELKELGIDSEIVPTVPSKLFKYGEFDFPKKFTVANYINPTQREIYFEELMTEVAKAMPDVNFIFFGDNTNVRKQKNINYIGFLPMEEIIKNSSCLTRIVHHDGLPHSPLQFLTAGRRVISNYDFKYFDRTKVDKKAIIEAIRKVQKQPFLPEIASTYWTKELDHEKYKRKIWQIVNTQ